MAIISAIIAFTGFTVGTGTIFGLSAGLSSGLIGIGRGILWSLASTLLAKPPSVPRQEVQANLSQATGPRIRGYGRDLIGGTRAFYEASDGILDQVIVAHHGPVHSIIGWHVDGAEVALDGAGKVITSEAKGRMWISATLSGDGGDYTDIKTRYPTLWTDDHKLTGLATFSVKMKAPPLDKLSKIFPRQDQTLVQMEAELSEVLDPRTGIVGYTDLTGPCVMDYLTHSDGYRIPIDAIDMDSFAQFADLCDQAVPLKDGGTENRYRIGGYYTLEDAPKEVMARLLATADAQIYMTPEGKVGVLGGEWLDPDVTITSDDILEFTLSDGVDEFTDFNILKGIFTSPDHRYQETEVEEMRDASALLTQPERVDTHSVEMCPSFPQMRRLMKCHWNANHREWTGSIRTNLVGLKARFPRGRGKHVIRLVIDDLGIDQPFEVLGHNYSVIDRTCSIEVASIENPYTWDAETEEGDPPPPLDDLITGASVEPPPTGLTLAQEVVSLSSRDNAARIVAVVDDPGREDLQLYAEYRRGGSGAPPINPWRPMSAGVGELRAYSDVMSDGREYDVRASWLGSEVYSASENILITSNPTAPDEAENIVISAAAGVVTVSWDNGISGYYETRVYRADNPSFGSASVLIRLSGLSGQPQSFDDEPGTGTWYYWAVTVNASQVEATPTGPVTITI